MTRLSVITLMLFCAPALRAAEPEVEVLARGPVHEGYAAAPEQKPTAGPIIPKKPAADVDELPPDQKPEGDNVIWLPGYWAWDDEREDFIWISGFWRVPPPNRVWMPGSWRQSGDGWQWVGGFWGAAAVEQQAELEYLPEPPATIDAGPPTPAPSETSIYVPGIWVFRDRYVWRPGYWIDYRENWIWIPSSYRWTPAGYVYVPGYWDYTLADRGILFAPVYIPQTVYVAPQYVWSPTIVVREQCMTGALFVHRGRGSYYFGDYFGASYASVGFTSWVGYSGGRDVVVARGFHDPMFSYYRVSNRNDPNWRGGINDLYMGRYRGTVPVPARTLIQQNNSITNVTVNNTTVINNKTVNVNQVQMVSNIQQEARTNNNLRLKTITNDARQEQGQTAKQINTMAERRNAVETQMLGKGKLPNRIPDAPRTARVDIPRAALIAQPATSKVNPPAQPKQSVSGQNIDPTPKKEQPKNIDPIPTPKKEQPKNIDPTPKKELPKVPDRPPPVIVNPQPKTEPVQPKLPPTQPKIEAPAPKLTPPAPKLEPAQPKIEPPPKINPPAPKIEPAQPKIAPPAPKVENPQPKGPPQPKFNPPPPPQPKINVPPPQPAPQPKFNPPPPPQPKVNVPPPQPAPQPKANPQPKQNPPAGKINPPPAKENPQPKKKDKN